MYILMLILHVLVSLVLMVVVLMQSGKGRGLAGAFGGGGGNQTLFGGRGAVDFLGKATWVLGGAFMFTSLTLAILTSAKSAAGGGVSKGLIPKSTSSAPALPPPESAPASPGGSGGTGGTGGAPPATPGGN